MKKEIIAFTHIHDTRTQSSAKNNCFDFLRRFHSIRDFFSNVIAELSLNQPIKANNFRKERKKQIDFTQNRHFEQVLLYYTNSLSSGCCLWVLFFSCRNSNESLQSAFWRFGYIFWRFDSLSKTSKLALLMRDFATWILISCANFLVSVFLWTLTIIFFCRIDSFIGSFLVKMRQTCAIHVCNETTVTSTTAVILILRLAEI